MRRLPYGQIGLIRALSINVAGGVAPAFVALGLHAIRVQALGEWCLRGIVYANCIGLPCQAGVPWILLRLRGRSQTVRNVGMALFLVAAAVAGCAAGLAILAALGRVPDGLIWPEFLSALRIALVVTLSIGYVTWVVSTLNAELAQAREELHARQLAEERANKVAAEARMASLESRVHPHFLFNTLNSIAALVSEDPPRAERTIERLAALLRASLDREASGMSSVSDELRVVRDYLEIEKVRFGPRLRYRIEADSASERRIVPALSIQTLVENSVKYAVGASAAGAEIVVRAWVRDGALRVEVEDDGPGFPVPNEPEPGHGLDLVTRRLTALSGAGASLETARGNGRTVVAMEVPA